MTQLILLHGWGISSYNFDNRWLISNDMANNDIATYFPQRDRWWPKWYANDDKWVTDLIYKVLDRGPVFIGGFSDGARTALRAAHIAKNVISGIVFHSGVYKSTDINNTLPAPTLVIAGKNDLTAQLPFGMGTNAVKFYLSYIGEDITLHVHPGKHEWHVDTNKVVINWIKTRANISSIS